ncbi:MAG: hypothetical protein HKN19_17630, partial [Halioglobus sp.]|nr:hypothetical protein [Halioglobus sp.]
MRTRTTVALLASTLALTACLNDNGGRQFIDVETTDAGRCEILDQLNCLFPFPSNQFLVPDEGTDTGWRVNLHIDSMPRNKQDVPVDPAEWNRNDGFSPSQMIVTQVPGLDLEQTGAPRLVDLTESLAADSPVQVIRASTGERHLIFSELDANTDDPGEKTFLIRPQAQFERGERYIVALRNLRDANGDLIEPPEVFRVLRDGQRTSNPAIEERRDSMEEIFGILEDAGIERDGLYLAWDFNVASVRNITERILHIRDEAFADLGNAAPTFTVAEVIDFPPCGEAGCNEGENELMSREVNGTFTVPNFLDSDSGAPGSSFFFAEPDDGLPDRMGGNNTLEANFICRIARSTVADYDVPPAAQARPSLYG